MIYRLPVLFALFVGFSAACSTAPPVGGSGSSASARGAPLSSSSSGGPLPSQAPEVASAAPDAGEAKDRGAISVVDAQQILFLRSENVPSAAASCPEGDREAKIRCLLGLRFEGDK